MDIAGEMGWKLGEKLREIRGENRVESQGGNRGEK